MKYLISESAIKNKLDEYIKNIYINIKNEENTYVIYGDYKYSYCRIELDYHALENDLDNYLKYIAKDIVSLISYEYFYTKSYKEEQELEQGSDKE